MGGASLGSLTLGTQKTKSHLGGGRFLTVPADSCLGLSSVQYSGIFGILLSAFESINENDKYSP